MSWTMGAQSRLDGVCDLHEIHIAVLDVAVVGFVSDKILDQAKGTVSPSLIQPCAGAKKFGDVSERQVRT